MALGDVERSYTINLIGQDKASSAFRNVGSSASRTSKIMAGLTKALKAAAIAAGVALAAAAALAAKYLWDATKAAYADDNAMKALARTQKKAQDATDAQTKSTARLIDKMELQSTFSDDELRPAMSALALTGMSVKKSQDLLALSLDVAAAKGKSVQSVAEALAKAYNGNTAGLSRMGIATKDAEGNALSLAEMLKTLEKRTKGAAAAAARRDPWTVLSHAMEQVKEKIGKKLLPMFRKLARWLIDEFVPWFKHTFVPAMGRFTKWIQNEAVPWIRDELIPALKNLWRWFKENVWPAVKDVWGAMTKLVDSVKDLFGSLNKDGESVLKFSDFLTALTLNLQLVLGIVNLLVGALNQMIGAMQWILENAARLGTVIGGIKDAVSGVDLNPFNADGGWVSGRSVVGEHGPELVTFPQGSRVTPHSRSMGGGGGGGTEIHIHGVVDKVGAAREVRKVLLELKRSNGGASLGLA